MSTSVTTESKDTANAEALMSPEAGTPNNKNDSGISDKDTSDAQRAEASLPAPSTTEETVDGATGAATAVAAAAPAPTSISVAEELLARLKPFLSEQHIEIEARLCNFSAPELPCSTTTTNSTVSPSTSDAVTLAAPQVLKGSYGRIQVGVSADDFARMRVFFEEEKKLPTQHITTKDIITDGGRYTYTVGEDRSETFTGCVEKKRLCNVEVYVPDCPYDIRLSVSTEVPRAAQTAPQVKPHGYVREKSRWTATEGTYEYAFTRVGTPANRRATFEVEVEGVHDNAQEGVTVAWLAELLDRLLAMARLKGNTGLPKSTFPDHRGGKRPRQ